MLFANPLIFAVGRTLKNRPKSQSHGLTVVCLKWKLPVSVCCMYVITDNNIYYTDMAICMC